LILVGAQAIDTRQGVFDRRFAGPMDGRCFATRLIMLDSDVVVLRGFGILLL
jgi:hypothetical protein